MSVSFFEVMRGDLRDRDGRQWPASFEIKAESMSLPGLRRDGQLRVSGVIEAHPWTGGAALHGEITISPLRRRTIEYRLAFDGDDEKRHELAGIKHLSLLRPVESLIRMNTTLRRQDEDVATGLLLFDLGEVFEFFRSWWLSSSRPPATQRDRALSRSELALLTAFVEGVIPAGKRVPAADHVTLSAVLEQLDGAPQPVQQAFRVGLRAIDGLARLRTGRRLARLSAGARASFLASVVEREPMAALLLQLLTVPIRGVHFQRADFQRELGVVSRAPLAAPAEPRHFARVKKPESLGAVTEVHAEVAIVGTGAGGAPLAAALAERGIAVAIIEEGRYRRRHQFVGAPANRLQALYRDAGASFAIGSPTLLPVGRLVGGTTAINSGTCLPTPDAVLQEWRSRLGFPSDFEPDAFDRYASRVRRALQVGPGDPRTIGPIGDVIARGADALGLRHGPLPRNAPGCAGAAECIIGCPEGAKRSTDVSYIPAALRAGAELYVGLPMTRILKRGSRVLALEARGTDEHGATKVVRVFADRFVLSCGALQTPVVLLDNGFRLPRIGRNLSVHPCTGLVARCPDPLHPLNTIPQGYGVHAHTDRGLQFETFNLPPQLLGTALPLVGHALTAWMDDFERLGLLGCMVRDEGVGWVRRGLSGRPLVGYRPSARTMRSLAFGCSVIAELFLEAGASAVTPGIAGRPLVQTREHARALADLGTSPWDWRLLGAHPLGTCAMGGSPETAVVDFEHRVFGTDNLYVVDGSSVPTSLGVNPQMTIMSMALRAADVLAHQAV